MLETLLLAGIVAAPLGLAGLVMPARRDACARAGRWSAIGRLALAVAATTALASAAAVSLRLLGAGGQDREAGIAGVVFVSLAWLPVTRRWNARAHLCWASGMFLVIVYLTCALGWTFARRSGPASTAGGVLLWVFELFAAVLSCAWLWEICEALGTEHRRRRIAPGAWPAAKDGDRRRCGRGHRHILSKMPAAPIPPPTHIDTIP